MPHWLTDIENEKIRARASAHEGRVRTSARRIAGIALAELWRSTSGAVRDDSFVVLLNECAADETKPDAVREAARRLMARVGPDFSSPSVDPLGDAEIILAFVRSETQKS